MSYWNCVYFLMVTMSTGGACGSHLIVTSLLDLVGYGDIVCKTKMGRVLQLLSLLVGLVRIFLSLVIDFTLVLAAVVSGSCEPPSQALFASVLPEILELLGQQSKWAGAYHGTKGKRYLCLCLHALFFCASSCM